MSHDHFFPKKSQKISHSLHMRARYGVSFVSSNSEQQRENMPTWLSWPRVNASLHNFPPLWAAVTQQWTWWQHQMHFYATLPMMVIEIRFNFQICVQCAEKAISKITFNIRRNLKQIWSLWHTRVSKCSIKGFENNGVRGNFFTWSYPPS